MNCPLCDAADAYVGLSVVECSNYECRAYSDRSALDATMKHVMAHIGELLPAWTSEQERDLKAYVEKYNSTPEALSATLLIWPDVYRVFKAVKQ